jgi:hypothetical protein
MVVKATFNAAQRTAGDATLNVLSITSRKARPAQAAVPTRGRAGVAYRNRDLPPGANSLATVRSREMFWRSPTNADAKSTSHRHDDCKYI